MTTIISLWLPVIISAVLVFIVSSILHMLFTYHNSDYKKLPAEDDVMEALNKFNIPSGDYMMPYTTDPKERKSKEFQDKFKKGPAAVITFFTSAEMNMGKSLGLWFIYCLIVTAFSAYSVGHIAGLGSGYMNIFKLAAMSSFAGYSLGLMQYSIWFRKSWSATIKSMFDGVIYALLTAGVFGWLCTVH